ncbi:MAG: hypothetical protein HGA85_04045 [Nanoarchaeota archaeon]|nr:hypothetical protein [Nanoarchaeota archaeon]
MKGEVVFPCEDNATIISKTEALLEERLARRQEFGLQVPNDFNFKMHLFGTSLANASPENNTISLFLFNLSMGHWKTKEEASLAQYAADLQQEIANLMPYSSVVSEYATKLLFSSDINATMKELEEGLVNMGLRPDTLRYFHNNAPIYSRALSNNAFIAAFNRIYPTVELKDKGTLDHEIDHLERFQNPDYQKYLASHRQYYQTKEQKHALDVLKQWSQLDPDLEIRARFVQGVLTGNTDLKAIKDDALSIYWRSYVNGTNLEHMAQLCCFSHGYGNTKGIKSGSYSWVMSHALSGGASTKYYRNLSGSEIDNYGVEQVLEKELPEWKQRFYNNAVKAANRYEKEFSRRLQGDKKKFWVF